MKKILFICLLTLSAILVYGKNPKYIFLFIGDGMATSQRMIAEEFARKTGRGKLAINAMPIHATTRTSSANRLVTDSAAAATAIACGEKTNNGRIGMDVSGKRKLESVAYAAQRKGKKIGIVSSVTINHATPAGFYANRPSRGQYYAIGLDLINSNFDYFGGGGLSKPNDKKSPEYKGDLYKLAEKAGYKVISTRKELLALRPGSGKVLARGANGALPYALNRPESAASLADFTRKGIELLDNPNGFFMMIEGGAIDWCGHANQAAENIHEVLALDEAVRVALEFAKKHKDETLIVVTGDHETGGMTMGFAGIGNKMYLERLLNQKCTLGQFHELVKKAQEAKKDFSFSDAEKLLEKYFGFKFSQKDKADPMYISSGDRKILQKGFKTQNLANAARLVMTKKAGIGWTTGSHTAQPVLTTSSGVKAEIFSGMYENTDIAKKLKSIL